MQWDEEERGQRATGEAKSGDGALGGHQQAEQPLEPTTSTDEVDIGPAGPEDMPPPASAAATGPIPGRPDGTRHPRPGRPHGGQLGRGGRATRAGAGPAWAAVAEQRTAPVAGGARRSSRLPRTSGGTRQLGSGDLPGSAADRRRPPAGSRPGHSGGSGRPAPAPGPGLGGHRRRGRARRVNARLRALEEGRVPEGPPAHQPRRQGGKDKGGRETDAAIRKRTQVARTHLQRGSIRRAARALTAGALADITPEVIQQLQDLHPAAPPPHIPVLPADSPSPAQVSADTLTEVLKHLPAGSAPGPSGWTYEHLRGAALRSDAAFDATLGFVNALLSGSLPSIPNLLASRLVALAKPEEGGPGVSSRVRPVAIGEVWVRLAGLCALAACPAAGPSLAPLQLGVGVRGGAQIVGHAVAASLPDKSIITMKVDVRNAFNSLDRELMLQEIAQRWPALSPYAAWAYGHGSALYVDHLPPLLQADGVSIQSEKGVRQGDPCGPLFFALGLQPVLERVRTQVPAACTMAYADDVTLQGAPDAVQKAFSSAEARAGAAGADCGHREVRGVWCGQ